MYDFIIIGAGTSGCVLANRLTASGKHNVLLLEAGGKADSLWVTAPIGFSQLMSNPKYAWLDKTVPTKGYGDRSIVMCQGKLLGGSASLNGLMYVRGHADDYNGWAEAGCKGWSWDDILPYFKKSQHFRDGDPELHGHSGEMGVSWYRGFSNLTEPFIKAAQEAGLPFNKDTNSGDHFGIGYAQAFIHKGKRQSTASAMLKSAENRPNLTVQTHVQVLQLIFEGRRAVGVEFKNDTGEKKTIRCEKEMIVSAGAIGSPQILQHSGVGDGKHLQSLGINVVVDAPQVGKNLQDHLAAHLQYRVDSPTDSINFMLSSKLRMAGQLLRWKLTGSGIMAKPATDVMGFFKSNDSLERPDIQIAMKPLTFRMLPTGQPEINDFPGMTVSAFNVNSFSRGEVRIKSNDAEQRTDIDIKYLSDEKDIAILTGGLLKLREVMQQPAVSHLGAVEIAPGPEVTEPADFEDYLRKTTETIYHPVGTCAMGGDDSSVLDPQLRVRGVEGLRVIDASVMPKITSGNTAAPSAMIGEKGADLVLADL